MKDILISIKEVENGYVVGFKSKIRIFPITEREGITKVVTEISLYVKGLIEHNMLFEKLNVKAELI